jgi:hypothetical protein
MTIMIDGERLADRRRTDAAASMIVGEAREA